jgi:hypothetical protein
MKTPTQSFLAALALGTAAGRGAADTDVDVDVEEGRQPEAALHQQHRGLPGADRETVRRCPRQSRRLEAAAGTERETN